MHYEVVIADGSDVQDAQAPVVQLRRDPYRIVRPVSKHGRIYEPGEVIELDALTAARFVAAGDIAAE